MTHTSSLFWFNVPSSASGPPASLQQPKPLPHSALSPCPIPLVFSNYFHSLLGFIPIAHHDAVPSDPQLSRCIQLCHLLCCHVHDLGLRQGSFGLVPPTLLLQDGGPSGMGESFALPPPNNKVPWFCLFGAREGRQRLEWFHNQSDF